MRALLAMLVTVSLCACEFWPTEPGGTLGDTCYMGQNDCRSDLHCESIYINPGARGSCARGSG